MTNGIQTISAESRNSNTRINFFWLFSMHTTHCFEFYCLSEKRYFGVGRYFHVYTYNKQIKTAVWNRCIVMKFYGCSTNVLRYLLRFNEKITKTKFKKKNELVCFDTWNHPTNFQHYLPIFSERWIFRRRRGGSIIFFSFVWSESQLY